MRTSLARSSSSVSLAFGGITLHPTVKTQKRSALFQDIKLETVVTLAIHGALGAAFVWLLVVCTPVTLDYVAGGSHFPRQFWVFMFVYDLVRPYFSFGLPAVLVLLWLDAIVFLFLHHQHGRQASLLWWRGVTLALVLASAFSVWTLNSPR